MISLSSVQMFARTVEHGSLTAAGRQLGVSTAVVSYRLGALEEYVGCALLKRTTRKVVPTAFGMQFYGHCLKILGAVADAKAFIDDANACPRAFVTMTAPLGLGRRIVAPAIARFGNLYPQIEVKLKLTDHILDLQAEGIDLALRAANFTDSSLTLRKIATVQRGLFASPEYVKKYGMPQTPEDLRSHKCLVLSFPGSQQMRWTFRHSGGCRSYEIAGPMQSDDGDVLTDWALAGLGIVLKPPIEVADHLLASRLVPVVAECSPQEVTLGILYPAQRLMPRWIRDFIDLLATEATDYVSNSLCSLGLMNSR